MIVLQVRTVWYFKDASDELISQIAVNLDTAVFIAGERLDCTAGKLCAQQQLAAEASGMGLGISNCTQLEITSLN